MFLRLPIMMLLIASICSPAFAYNPVSILAQGLASQCWISFTNALQGVMPSKFPDDIRELNFLLSKHRYRSSSVIIVGNTKIAGYINRTFILKEGFRAENQSTPTNNIVYQVVRANREDGLREIISKIGNANVEHSWVYIPAKELWVETTFAAAGANVQVDAVVTGALENRYGRIEIFHTHPPKVLEYINSQRQFKMEHPLIGALPSDLDLFTANRKAWTDRRIAKIFGIIHSLGVTYYTPTRDLLLSSVGAPIVDADNFYVLFDSRLKPKYVIDVMIELQKASLCIEKFDDQPNPLAFNIKFIPLEDLSTADEWLNSHAVSLTPEEENARKNSRR